MQQRKSCRVTIGLLPCAVLSRGETGQGLENEPWNCLRDSGIQAKADHSPIVPRAGLHPVGIVISILGMLKSI